MIAWFARPEEALKACLADLDHIAVIMVIELTSVSPSCNGLGAQPSVPGLAVSLRHVPSQCQPVENLGHTISKLNGDLICDGLGHVVHVGRE